LRITVPEGSVGVAEDGRGRDFDVHPARIRERQTVKSDPSFTGN